jgi:polar amino acid transport system substrate-binding protein
VRSVDDLGGLTVGIQVGNTSDAVARELERRGAIAEIRYYPYDGIADALDELTAGRIGAFIKLLPVMRWLTRGRPELAVVQEIPTHERLGIAVAPDCVQLQDAINRVLADLRRDGELDKVTARWIR